MYYQKVFNQFKNLKDNRDQWKSEFYLIHHPLECIFDFHFENKIREKLPYYLGTVKNRIVKYLLKLEIAEQIISSA